jgi:hypothetical protein
MSMEDYNFVKAREAWATPMKIVQYNCLCGRTMKFESEHGVIAPKREWVGLTVEEIAACCMESTTTQLSFYNAIEAKLKEKNT